MTRRNIKVEAKWHKKFISNGENSILEVFAPQMFNFLCLIASQKRQKSFWTHVEDIKNNVLYAGDTLVKNLHRATRRNIKLEAKWQKNSFKKVQTQFWRPLLLKCSIFGLIASQKRQKSFWRHVEDIKNNLLHSGNTLVKKFGSCDT